MRGGTRGFPRAFAPSCGWLSGPLESSYDEAIDVILQNMKKTTLSLMMAMLLCSACNLPALTVGGGGGADADVGGAGLRAQMAQEYRNMAALERDYMHDVQAAGYYTAKAEDFDRGQDIWPDNPNSYVGQLDTAGYGALVDAYDMVLSARRSADNAENAPLLALAQSRFDCWLNRARVRAGDEAIDVCRDMTVRALGLLAIADNELQTYAVYFPDEDGIMFDNSSVNTIVDVAAAYELNPEWSVLLTGHALADDKHERTRNLANRRAVAVRNALLQQGVDPDHMTIVAHTEKKDSAAAQRVDITIAPPYLLKDKGVSEVLENIEEY